MVFSPLNQVLDTLRRITIGQRHVAATVIQTWKVSVLTVACQSKHPMHFMLVFTHGASF
jgi:hypothetical protein